MIRICIERLVCLTFLSPILTFFAFWNGCYNIFVPAVYSQNKTVVAIVLLKLEDRSFKLFAKRGEIENI